MEMNLIYFYEVTFCRLRYELQLHLLTNTDLDDLDACIINFGIVDREKKNLCFTVNKLILFRLCIRRR